MRTKLVDAALGWVDTPYHHHARVKGAGIDCAQLLVAVAIEVGMLDERRAALVPNYPPEWHLHNREEHLLQYMELMGCEEVSEPLPGDIVCFKFGRTCSHVGILLNSDQFIHACLRSNKVVVNSFNEDWNTRWVKTYSFPGVNNG